ncbi:uncharacterized protein LOC119485545 [Scomber scombrus]|uniref:Uncharacterized protein LOC119485545 n=1 Tax=Scomber scombrus TaxID=13677 RepID=A0AAV1NKY9_SCOSC
MDSVRQNYWPRSRSFYDFTYIGLMDSAARSETEEQVTSSVGTEQEDDYTVPAALPCSEEEEGEKEKEDLIDGWMSWVVFDAIKSAVYHLLNLTIRNYRVDQCYGCKISHPSQRQHECLEVLEDDFFQNHYYDLMKKLVIPRFIPAIQRLLFT